MANTPTPPPTAESPSGPDRRTLLGAFAGAGLLGCGTKPAAAPFPELEGVRKILFQGDSITDTSRSRETAGTPNDAAALGSGYAFLASASLLSSTDEDLAIFNRGISGNRVPDLDARWDAECIALEPDLLSILIGVNDIWRTIDSDSTGTADEYRAQYDALLARTREALPETRLVICEPFVLRCGAVNDSWFPRFHDYRAAAREMADKYGATFVPFHEMFERASELAPPERWAGDGVHPSADGAALMAAAWLAAVRG